MGTMVKEHVGVIILAVFIFIAVCGPIGCILLSRRREYKKFHPSPKAFRQARAKLGTVAECMRDTEKGLSGDPEWTDNCPICIGPLCPESADDDALDAMVEIRRPPVAVVPRDTEASRSHIAAAGRSGHGGGGGGGEEGEGGGGGTVRASVASSAAPVVDHPPRPAHRERERDEPRLLPGACLPGACLPMGRHRIPAEREVEILKLKSCGHWFHARCLSSWFLIDRYDCPVCRKSYWEGKVKRRGPMETFLRNNYSPAPTVARLGFAAMV